MECEMCGKEHIRYCHILSHPEYSSCIRVGCVCASKMTGDYITPRENEKNLKNQIKRKKNFLSQDWYPTRNGKGERIRYKGCSIQITKSKYGKYGILFRNIWHWNFNGKEMATVNEAKEAAFYIFDKYRTAQPET